MRLRDLHAWDITPAEAIELQHRLRQSLKLKPEKSLSAIQVVAGCDMALDPARNEGYAGVIVYRWPELQVIERQSAILPLRFPYIPGLLSFREIPVLGAAIQKLKTEPQLFFVDGQGIAHPRGMGIACHLGLLLEKPTIGCAKSLLYGSFKEPGPKKGDAEPLYAKDKQIIGKVLRTKPGCRPLFISPGHLMDLESSLQWVLRSLDGYRLPKPTREADAFVGKLKISSPDSPDLFN